MYLDNNARMKLIFLIKIMMIPSMLLDHSIFPYKVIIEMDISLRTKRGQKKQNVRHLMQCLPVTI